MTQENKIVLMLCSVATLMANAQRPKGIHIVECHDIHHSTMVLNQEYQHCYILVIFGCFLSKRDFLKIIYLQNILYHKMWIIY